MRAYSHWLTTTTLAAPLAAATLFAAHPAAAQPIDGLYVGAGVGLDFRQNDIVKGFSLGTGPTGRQVGTPGRLHTNYDVGFAGLGSIGWGFGNGFRVEVEGDYRRNDVRHLEGTSFPTSANGTAQTFGVMTNVLYDFDFTNLGLPVLDVVHPYVGAGVGYQWTDFGGISASNAANGFNVSTHGTNGNFAYQGIVGVAYPLEAVPGLDLTLEYRFLGLAANTKFRSDVTSGGITVPGKVSIGDQFNHAIMFGVRYAFNVAPPPAPAPIPVAAPAQQPARSYLVFFDWDRADLSDRARQIIGEAAQNSTHVQYTRIEVNGYTDTSGSPAYNQRLSVRRAQNVAAELVRDGVPRQAIAIQGFGQTHLLVPTADGVREPQNRRVEIIIR